MSLLPPAISDMGTSSGFTWYVQDRAGLGYEAFILLFALPEMRPRESPAAPQ